MAKKNFIYKILAIMMLLTVIFAILPPVTAYAATDTVYIESLINEDSKTYTTNVITDTFSKNKKYDYRYVQMSAYLKNACDGIDGSAENANYCYSLTDKLPFSSSAESDKWISGSSSNITQAEFFIKSEGYFDNSLQTTDKGSDDTQNLLDGDSKSAFYSDSAKDTSFMAMEYPSNPNGADATPEENEYAVNVSSTLTASLNQVLNLVNAGSKYSSIEDLINRSILIRPMTRDSNIAIVSPSSSKNLKGYVIVYAPSDKDSNGTANTSTMSSSVDDLLGRSSTISFSTADEFFDRTGLPKVDTDGNLLMYVFETENTSNISGSTFTLSTSKTDGSLDSSSMSTLVYAMPKGYKTTPGGKLLFPGSNGKEQSFAENDVPYITIHMVSQSANNLYKQYGMSISTVDHTEEQGTFVKIITSFINSIVNGISTLLQLSPVNELVYNGGLRGSSTYNYGTMTDNWWSVVIRYHLIFQAIAWFIIILGFLKTLIGLNLSTVNPGYRENVYNSIQKFIITGFMLVLIIPAVQFAMSMNASVVRIFASQVDTTLTGAPAISGIAGILISIVYLAINIYINFIYIMRSITIALLIVSAPFFISTISITGLNRAKMFMSWFKELITNIFLQSVHAFSLAFLINLMQSGTGLENIVISFSIIPITEMFRALILAGGAGTTEGLAKEAGAKYTSMANGAASALAGGVAGTVASIAGRGDTPEGEDIGGGSSNKSGGRGNDGFGALDKVSNNKISQLQESGLKDFQTDENEHKHVASGVAKMAGVGAARAGKGLVKSAAGVASMAGNIAMSELSGNPRGYGAAGTTAGTLMAGAVDSIGSGGMFLADHWKDKATNYNANDTRVSPSELNALGEPGQGVSVVNGEASVNGPSLQNAVSNKNELATHISAALGGSSEAKKWLSYKGISNVHSDGSDGAMFNVGRPAGSASAVRRSGNTVTARHDFGAGVVTSTGDRNHPSATLAMTSEQFNNECTANPAFRDKFQSVVSSANEGQFAGGSFANKDGKVFLTFNGAEASQNGRSILTKGTGPNVRNLYSTSDSENLPSYSGEDVDTFRPSQNPDTN